VGKNLTRRGLSRKVSDGQSSGNTNSLEGKKNGLEGNNREGRRRSLRVRSDRRKKRQKEPLLDPCLQKEKPGSAFTFSEKLTKCWGGERSCAKKGTFGGGGGGGSSANGTRTSEGH